MPAAPLPAPPRPRVMLIDPDERARAALLVSLAVAGVEVVASLRSPLAAVYVVRQYDPGAIVVDLEQRPCGAWSGLALVAELARECPGVPVLVTAPPVLLDLGRITARALAAGACRVLPRGAVAELVAAIVEAATGERRGA